MSSPDAGRAAQALVALRVVVAVMMFIHGGYRVVDGSVPGFGSFLSGQGIPYGLVVAWAISAVEVIGAPLLAAGRFTRPIAAWFAVQLAAGIYLVHGNEGWFVVGGGRNGMEFSVLLIAALLGLVWAG